MNKTAIVIGATGLVGSSLVNQLLNDERFYLVKVFVRRTTGIQHKKLREYIIDFNEPEQWRHEVTGDVLFSCLGTTIKKAGSKQNQYLIDHTYQFLFASSASGNGVPSYVLVSSYMADPNARLFYTKMKGELERDIKKLPFQKITILQPGILKGERKEVRAGEKIGIRIIELLNSIGLFKSQKPVPATVVAKAMINSYFRQSEPVRTWKLLEVFDLAHH